LSRFRFFWLDFEHIAARFLKKEKKSGLTQSQSFAFAFQGSWGDFFYSDLRYL